MLELKNISYIVNEDGKEKAILKDINLTVNEHFVAITGPNGGGKSTLAKIIAGIIKPTTGQIEYNRTCKERNQLCISAAGSF